MSQEKQIKLRELGILAEEAVASPLNKYLASIPTCYVICSLNK